MARLSWYGGVAAALLLACPVSAFAQTETTPPAEAQAETPAEYTDAQLHAFAAASAEIDPISRALPSATEEQRTEATTQIREILTRNNIDADTYNAMAAQAQTDAAFAARISALHTASPTATPESPATETPPAQN
ncbi:MAG: DUF4168 domain-containing protein [Hyphomonadaceae bacterium]